MSIFKKFAAPLVAVALVAVMGVSLLSAPRTAEAAATAGTASTSFTGTIWNNSTVATTLPGITIAESGTWAAADTITINHAGLTSSAAAGVTCTNCTIAYAATTTTVTITAVTAGADSVGVDRINLAVTASGAEATHTITVGTGAAAAGSVTSNRLVMGVNPTISTTAAAPINRLTQSVSADSTAAGTSICALAADAAGALSVGLPVTFTVSLGVVSTGSAKSAIALTSALGGACTNYRGGGGIASTDTAIASNSSSNTVSTFPITLTAPAGNTASKLVLTAPTQGAVSPSQLNVSPGYTSPTTATNLSVQVTDSAGLGVNSQVVLVTTDKGALVAGFFQTCGTSKAVTGTSASSALTPGGETKAGVIQLTYCGNQADTAGQATITASNISTSMANVTTTVATAGRPAKVTAVYTNGTVDATVVDANGNNVANGTPVQFTISANAGAVSNACTTTTNGKASSAVSLNTGSGSVIVTASYNETGSMAACAVAAVVAPVVGTSFGSGSTGPGAQGLSTVVNIGTVVTPPPTSGGTTGAGGFAAAPVYSASKLAQAVFNGGTVAQLEAAVVAGNGTGVWAQDSKGVFVLYIVNGGFVNDAFKAAFPTGFAGVTAVTVVGK